MTVAVLLADWIGGALPTLGLAWVIRRLMHSTADRLSVAVISTFLAGILAYVIRSIGGGEGGFTARVSNILSGSELLSAAGATGFALAATLLWWGLRKPKS